MDALYWTTRMHESSVGGPNDVVVHSIYLSLSLLFFHSFFLSPLRLCFPPDDDGDHDAAVLATE